MQYAYDSDIGQLRKVNQDCTCVLKNSVGQIIAVVCDGMGGHKAGEVASRLALDTICQAFLDVETFISEKHAIDWLKHHIEIANQNIINHTIEHPETQGMGTTVVACIVLKDSVVIGNIGDSRAYAYNEYGFIQLTEDDSYVNMLIKNGLDREAAKSHPKRHVLLKALGVFDQANPTIYTIPRIGDHLMLCSDGLYNVLSEDEILDILMQDESINLRVNELILRANQAGGIDNITVVVLEEGGSNNGK